MNRKESIFEAGREFLEPVFRRNMERMLQEYRECEEEILNARIIQHCRKDAGRGR